MAGLEPARLLGRGILSPLRLPIPPHRLAIQLYDILPTSQVIVEKQANQLLLKTLSTNS